jgi:hypothetical protein
VLCTTTYLSPKYSTSASFSLAPGTSLLTMASSVAASSAGSRDISCVHLRMLYGCLRLMCLDVLDVYVSLRVDIALSNSSGGQMVTVFWIVSSQRTYAPAHGIARSRLLASSAKIRMLLTSEGMAVKSARPSLDS